MNPRYLLVLSHYQSRDRVALQFAIVGFGLMLWQYVLETSPFLVRIRPQVEKAYWILLLIIYLVIFTYLAIFFNPQV